MNDFLLDYKQKNSILYKMSSIIKAYSDIFIKYLFGSERNKNLLLSFLNSVLLNSGFPKVVEIEITNPFNLKTFIYDKESILDIKVIDENKRQFNVEVQSTGNEIFSARALYYWSKLYSSQIKESQKYNELKATISINILNFNLINDKDKYHSTFMLMEKNNPELVLTDHIIIHFLELQKLNFNITKEQNKLLKWLNYLKGEGKGDKEMEILIIRR